MGVAHSSFFISIPLTTHIHPRRPVFLSFCLPIAPVYPFFCQLILHSFIPKKSRSKAFQIVAPVFPHVAAL